MPAGRHRPTGLLRLGPRQHPHARWNRHAVPHPRSGATAFHCCLHHAPRVSPAHPPWVARCPKGLGLAHRSSSTSLTHTAGSMVRVARRVVFSPTRQASGNRPVCLPRRTTPRLWDTPSTNVCARSQHPTPALRLDVHWPGSLVRTGATAQPFTPHGGPPRARSREERVPPPAGATAARRDCTPTLPLNASNTFDSLRRVLFTVRSSYFSTIGLARVFGLARGIPRRSGCTPKKPYSWADRWDPRASGRRRTRSGVSWVPSVGPLADRSRGSHPPSRITPDNSVGH